MTNFFISYNQADSTWAEWIAWQLEEAGYTTILQAWDFRPSENFVIKMNEAIRATERMITVLSPDYVRASFSSSEWASAFAQDPRGEKGILLPVRVRECDLKGFFDQIIYVDLVGKDEAEAKKALLSGVQRGRAKPPTKPEFPKTTERLIAEHPSFPGPTARKFPAKSLRAVVILFVVFIGAFFVFWPRFKRWQEPPRYCPRPASGDLRYYEAEYAELWGGASKDSEHLGFSGDGFVSGYGAEPDAITTFWVDVPTAGEYQVDLCYANATNSAKMLSIYVNEERVKQTRLPHASRWNIWLTKTETLPLKAGRNAISYRKTPGDTGQVNLDFIGVLQNPTIPASPQPTTTPMPTPSVAKVPSPSATQETKDAGPPEDEMKQALLREMLKRGAQKSTADPDSVVINNPIAGMTIKVEKFLKLGCKPTSYGVSYECTYTIIVSQSFHSNEGTEGGRKHFEAFNRLFGGLLEEGTVTRKFARSSEGWVIVRD